MKMNLMTWLRAARAVVLLGGMTWFGTGCTVHEGVAYTEPYGAYYDYYYYPDYDVYYYPEGRVYYWNDGGHWNSGMRLPPRYELRGSHREYMRGHTRQPWTERHEREEHEEHEHH